MIENTAPSACPACGFTEKTLASSFKLGCSHCYEAFSPHLATILPKLHRDTIHVGKVPKHQPGSDQKLRQELKEIEGLLTAHSQDSARTDALLERWKEIRDALAKQETSPNLQSQPLIS